MPERIRRASSRARRVRPENTAPPSP
jgi:hypothetical protein